MLGPVRHVLVFKHLLPIYTCKFVVIYLWKQRFEGFFRSNVYDFRWVFLISGCKVEMLIERTTSKNTNAAAGIRTRVIGLGNQCHTTKPHSHIVCTVLYNVGSGTLVKQ